MNLNNFNIVLFGATGDLTRRKLIPTLFKIYISHSMHDFTLYAFARKPLGSGLYQEELKKILDDLFPTTEDFLKNNFLNCIHYIQSHFDDSIGYEELAKLLPVHRGILYYFSVSPTYYSLILKQLQKFNLHKQSHFYNRLILEKPFGRDYATALELNNTLYNYFKEEQIYRIDHYLGKESIQNIIFFRFANPIFEGIWNAEYIKKIKIYGLESIDIGTRAGYYDSFGALRDMIQSHLMQILTLVGMEKPTSLSQDAIRDAKVKFLKSIQPIKYNDVGTHSFRAQYEGYLDHAGIAKDSQTETLAALKILVHNEQWRGVPFYLITAKAHHKKETYIEILFNKKSHSLFNTSEHQSLRIELDPIFNIILNFNYKNPASIFSDTKLVPFLFTYDNHLVHTISDYEKLLLDAINGNKTSYVRKDEVEISWGLITKILQGWEKGYAPLLTYPKGFVELEPLEKFLNTN